MIRARGQQIRRGGGIDQPEHPQRAGAVVPAGEQPARALRQGETHEGVDDRRDRGDAEHVAPGVLAEPAQPRIGGERDHDAEDDVELKHPGQFAALRRGRDLRDVKRRRHRGDADPDAADEARGDEGVNVIGQRAAERGNDVEHADEEQGVLAAKFVRRPAAEQ